MTEQIPLTPVDHVDVLTVVDNVADALLADSEVARRLAVTGRPRER